MTKMRGKLPTLDERTPEERTRIARMGQAASTKRKAELRLLKDELKILLSLGSDVSNQEKLCFALLEKGLAGDTKAFEVIRDSIGQKPVEKQETTIVDRTPFEIKIIK